MRDKTILLVEDDPSHVRLMMLNLERAGADYPFVIVEDGQEALDYLYGRTGSVLPDLIMFDLGLPEVDGLQLLEHLAGNTILNAIPRIIVTTSDEQDDQERCAQFGYDAYFTKPPDYKELAHVIAHILH
ncbi:MAG: response regulator [Anaerolineae bacterium]